VKSVTPYKLYYYVSLPFQTSPKFPAPSCTVSWISLRGISQWSRVSRERSYICGRMRGHGVVSSQHRPDALPAQSQAIQSLITNFAPTRGAMRHREWGHKSESDQTLVVWRQTGTATWRISFKHNVVHDSGRWTENMTTTTKPEIHGDYLNAIRGEPMSCSIRQHTYTWWRSAHELCEWTDLNRKTDRRTHHITSLPSWRQSNDSNITI